MTSDIASDRTASQAGSDGVVAADVSPQAGIADGLAGLDDLDARPLAEHAPIYEQLHDRLQSVLAEIDGA